MVLTLFLWDWWQRANTMILGRCIQNLSLRRKSSARIGLVPTILILVLNSAICIVPFASKANMWIRDLQKLTKPSAVWGTQHIADYEPKVCWVRKSVHNKWLLYYNGKVRNEYTTYFLHVGLYEHRSLIMTYRYNNPLPLSLPKKFTV